MDRRQFLRGSVVAPIAGIVHAADSSSPHVVAAEEVAFTSDPNPFFGANIEWVAFQSGFLNEGSLDPELVKLMTPFSQGYYRYPGGQKANWFSWEASIGARHSRAPQVSENGEAHPADFGLEEYFTFLSRIRGRALLVCNLFGKKGHPESLASRFASNAKLIDGVLEGEFGSPEFPVDWELWNELDWGELKWPVERIAERGKPIARNLMMLAPSSRIYIPTKTAGFLDLESARTFNRAIGREFSGVSENFSSHIYYEGMPVESVLEYLDDLLATLKAEIGPNARVLVTEHARWPNKPRTGKWEDTWYRTGNLEGALATADFVIGARARHGIAGLLYHQLGGRGPWQLVFRDKRSGVILPSVVYWALRVLKHAFQADVLGWGVDTAGTGGRTYSVRTLVSAKDNILGVAVVNLSRFPRTVWIQTTKRPGVQLVGSLQYVGGGSITDYDSTAAIAALSSTEEAVELKVDSSARLRLWVPPYSVSGYRLTEVG